MMNDDISDNTAVGDRSIFVPPGHTGFIVPLNPPHGAVLSTVDINLSFVPTKNGIWGIYKDAPTAFWQSGNYYSDVADPAEWESVAGVYVEVWRFATLDTGFDLPALGEWSDHTPEYGYGELIHREDVSLSSSAPSQNDNDVSRWASLTDATTYKIYAGREFFKKVSFDITAPEDSGLRVDRRLYSYAIVIRFVGGPRRESGGLAVPFSWDDPPAFSITRAGEADYSSYHSFTLIRQPAPSEVSTELDALAFEWGRGSPISIYGKRGVGPRLEHNPANIGRIEESPRVKFRGARLGYLTDRAGNGGW
jgi:hypothetical protein